MGKKQVAVLVNPPGSGGWWDWVVEVSFSYNIVPFLLSIPFVTVLYLSRETRLVQNAGVMLVTSRDGEGLERGSGSESEDDGGESKSCNRELGF